MAEGSKADRQISLGVGCSPIPESLLLAHARGRVLFITGAGTSAAAGLPNFRKLVIDTYEAIDTPTHHVLRLIPDNGDLSRINISALNTKQRAEVNQFCKSNYDVVLGMLERRIDGAGTGASSVRERIADCLRRVTSTPAAIHRALIKLADRGGAHSIATTNFDLLLEAAATRHHIKARPYSLGAIPRPSLSRTFAGVLHIHGALDPNGGRTFDFIVTDEDFGEFYMRRRVVPDFVYDAARLYNIVLVGYSANDPPMRYLLSAVAADGSRFEDFKERFTFVGGPIPADQVMIEDWRGRGITPISYDAANHHEQLLKTLERWAALSAVSGKPIEVDRLIRSTVRKRRVHSTDQDRDLFDHLIRRADPNERIRLAKVASDSGAELAWLDAIVEITNEPRYLDVFERVQLLYSL